MNIKDFLLGYEAGAAQGGGSSADVRYVTFMSHDGTVELGKKAVAVGDDCADPIARGIFDTPTKESTAQYDYSFVGWATTPNGAWDEAALDAVTEDRTLYAAYAAAVRYYTITFYDDDGTTVLKTQTLAYGAMPSYTPTKTDYAFSGWTPDIAAVTGDASYTAVWEEKITFYSGSWAKIAEVCASGNAANTFAVGEYKPVTLTYSDGTTETINFRIIDMGVDLKEDGSYAPLTIMADSLVKDFTSLASASNKTRNSVYNMDTARAFLDSIYSAMPTDLRAVMATTKKDSFGFYYEKIFIPSATNLGISASGWNYNNEQYMLPKAKYKYFADGNSIRRYKLTDSAADDYWTASPIYETTGVYSYLAIDGTARMGSAQSVYDNPHGICPCFCI